MLTFPLTAQRMQTEDLLSKGAVATGHSLVWEWGVWKGGNSQSLFVKIPLWVPLSLPGSANTCLIHVHFPSPYQLPSASLMSITTTPNILFGFSWRWYYSRWGFWPFWWVTQVFFFFFFFFLVSFTYTCYLPSVEFACQFILRPTKRTQQYREKFLIPPCIAWSMLLSGHMSPLTWIHWPLPMLSDGRDGNFSTEKLSWWFK